jgi:hypothetical protein
MKKSDTRQQGHAGLFGTPGSATWALFTVLSSMSLAGATFSLAALLEAVSGAVINIPVIPGEVIHAGVVSALMITGLWVILRAAWATGDTLSKILYSRRAYALGKTFAALALMQFANLPTLLLMFSALKLGFTPSPSFLGLWVLAALIPFVVLAGLTQAVSGCGRVLALRIGEFIRTLFRGRVR